MATWEEIRDEIAGMLADGQPLEDVIAKLEKRKNEMAKANLLKAMDDMKKPKPMTNEEYLRSLNTEQLAEEILAWWFDGANAYSRFGLFQHEIDGAKDKIMKWLKEKHNG